jgi:Flp pilus assembly protein TadG
MPRPKGKQVEVDTTLLTRALTTESDVQSALETLDEAAFIVRRVNTTNATPTVIYSFAIPADSTVGVTAKVAGKRTNGTGRIFFVRTNAAYREGTGNAAFEGGEQSPTSKDGPGNPGYDVDLQLNVNTLEVVVTGVAAHDISWTARIELTVAP